MSLNSAIWLALLSILIVSTIATMLIYLYVEINSKNINILLVDDISRTGDSVGKAIECLKSKLPLSNISVAVLVVCGRRTDKNIDYNPYMEIVIRILEQLLSTSEVTQAHGIP